MFSRGVKISWKLVTGVLNFLGKSCDSGPSLWLPCFSVALQAPGQTLEVELDEMRELKDTVSMTN